MEIEGLDEFKVLLLVELTEVGLDWFGGDEHSPKVCSSIGQLGRMVLTFTWMGKIVEEHEPK